MRSADITFVIITKNEERNIASCLGSLPGQSAVTVYDAFSTDSTVGIAVSLGAAVVQAPWGGYVQARTSAARQVTTPWTFMLDADERISPELMREIDALEPPDDVGGYSIPRRNHFCGRWIRSSGWWPDRLVRLIRTGRARMTARGSGANAVHETWLPEGRTLDVQSAIDHYSYKSVADYRRKFALYTGLEAQAQSSGLSTVILAWGTAPLRLAWNLVRHGGLLEGWRGVYVCSGSALYPAVVATKSWRQARAAAQQPIA